MLDRIQALRSQIKGNDLDCILIGSSANRRYISGFTGSAGWLLISANIAIIAVDFRYVEQAKKETNGLEVFYVRGDIASWLPEILNSIGITRLGVESEHLSINLYQQLENTIKTSCPQIKIIATKSVIESLRMIKDETEIEYIEKAAEIGDQAMQYAREHMRPGISEKALAWELESYMRQRNSEAIPFEIIVASGINAALPHARPTEKQIGKGDTVTIDLGARVNGYCSDITRTFIIGNEDATFNKVYNIVLGAQLTALAAIEAAMSGEAVDGLVREIITKAGYGEEFGHGLGHGVGLETHELPRLGTKSNDILKENMVFTVEPGIYIPGWGGIRIEDTVTIKDGKIRSLTSADKSAHIQGG
ncbi:MAG: Xaa-Pro peptidase family protein [Dehalococcoidia bacterium]|nr:Xaa-Pro peptidase family protein [Dehalococcoidia bacterium]MDD5493096.1 Xaa-Pro peptidase family protein [Dehalococcoidia bacterium]